MTVDAASVSLLANIPFTDPSAGKLVLSDRGRQFASRGQEVVVTYTDPTAGDDDDVIENADGLEAASFTTGVDGVPAVTNNSTVDTTGPVLFSNLEQTLPGTAVPVGHLSSEDNDIAQAVPFVTGPNPSGYLLQSAKVDISNLIAGQGTLTASIYDDSSGTPGSEVHALNDIAAPMTGETTLDTDGSFLLSPDTTYWLVLELDDQDPLTVTVVYLRDTPSEEADPGGEPGWSSGVPYFRATSSGSWTEVTTATRVKFAILGVALPQTLVSNHDSTLSPAHNVTASATSKHAVRFTTGADEYVINAVTVYARNTATGDVPVVELYSSTEDTGASTAAPKASLVTFIAPAGFANNVQYFTAPLGTELAANTSYWIVASASSGDWDLARNTAEASHADAGSVEGWAIHGYSSKQGAADWDSAGTAATQEFAHPRISVHGQLTRDTVVGSVALSNLNSAFYSIGNNFVGSAVSLSFSTGAATHGYDLTAIRTKVWTDPDIRVKVSLYDDTWGPSQSSVTALAEFRPPPNLYDNQGTLKTFTTPAPVHLAPSKVYTVVFERMGGSGEGGMYVAATGKPSTSGARSLPDWSFTDGRLRYAATLDFRGINSRMPAMAVIAAARDASLQDVHVTSRPLDGIAYRVGEHIELHYVFDSVVHYDSGDADLQVMDDERAAAYWSGSGTNHLLYRYRVRSGDSSDATGVTIKADSLAATTDGSVIKLDGGTVTLEHTVKSDLADHKVDTSSTSCRQWLCADVDTARSPSDANKWGAYYDNQGNSSGSLSNRLFAHGGVNYTIMELLAHEEDGRLEMLLDRAPSDELIEAGVLRLRGLTFELDDADIRDERRLIWTDAALSWKHDGNPTRKIYAVGNGRAKPHLHADLASEESLFTSFTTGPGSHRLAQVSINASLMRNGVRGGYEVKIFADNSGTRGSELETLVAPSGLPGTATVARWTFTSSSGLLLEPDTTYWVGVKNKASRTMKLHLAPGSSELSRSADGWSIGNSTLTWTGQERYSRPIMMAIRTDASHIRISLQQSETPKLISNLDQDNHRSGRNLGSSSFASPDIAFAIPFRTGPSPRGYLLQGAAVDILTLINFGGDSFEGTLTAVILSDSGGSPGAEVHSLGEISHPSAGTATFDDAGTFILQPSTSYWLKLELDDQTTGSNLALRTTLSQSTDTDDTEPGWSRGSDHSRGDPTEDWVPGTSSTGFIKFALLGEAL